MAQIREVRLVDDLDQSPADQTVTFGLDSKSFEIDLTDAHAEELRTALADYVKAGRPVKASASPGPQRRQSSGSASVTNIADRKLNGEIREWAKAEGMKVAERGRIPAEITEAFHAANGKPTGQARPVDSSGHSRDECDDLDTCPTHKAPEKAAQTAAPAFADGSAGESTPAPQKPSQDEPTTVEEFNRRVIAWHEEKGTDPKIKKDGTPGKAAVDRYLAAQQAATA